MESHEMRPLGQEDGAEDPGLGHPHGPFRVRSDLSDITPVPIHIKKNELIKAHNEQYSKKSFTRFCPSNRMPRIYGYIGYWIGGFPLLYFTMGIIMCVTASYGLLFVELKDNVRDGYTPTTSRARLESNVLRNFMNSSIDPTSTIALFRAKDGGSMHRLEHLKEALDLSDYFKSNLTVSCMYNQNCTFMDVCGSFCHSNWFIKSVYYGLEEQVTRYREGKTLNPSTNITFPRGKSNSFQFHLEGNFFGVKTRNGSDNRPPPVGTVPITNCSCESSDLTEVKAVSYIDYVELVMVVYRGDFMHPNDEEKMRNWEMGLYRHTWTLKTDKVEVLLLGNEIVDFEMKEDGRKMAPYFAAGMALTVVFVLMSVIADSIVSDVMDSGKFIMAFFVILCPTLSLMTTFGIFGWLGWRVNSVSLITPFLIMGIGVNDAFLLIHAWHRSPIRDITLSQRMGLILEDVGPSITITTVTDVTTFILGSLTPTEEISIFCYITATALLWCYLFTLLIFVPAMTYCTKLENKHCPINNPVHKETTLSKLYNKVSVAYCKHIMHPATGIVVIVLVILSLSAAIIGFIRIDSRLDTEKILPYDSPIIEPHRLIAHKVWTDYYPVTIFVNKPVDLDNNTVRDNVNTMIKAFESVDKCKGSDFSTIWVRDYEEFKKEDSFFGDFLDFEDSEESTTTTAASVLVSKPYYNKLGKFLNHLYYQHYKSFLKIDKSKEIPVRAFWFTVIYHNTTNWDEKIALMLQLREVADQFPGLDVSVWEVNGMFVDQMLSLKSLTYFSGGITILCMAIISIFFISHAFLIWLAVMSISSIALEVIGFLSWWGLDLDPVTLCAFLMSVGMSVDFTAHIAYHFKLTDIARVHHGKLYRYELKTKQHKVIATLESVGWPTAQAGVSTVVCVLPLILLQNYIPLVFVKTISLVVIFGLLHGLLIMPAVYALSWQCLYYLKKLLGMEKNLEEQKHQPNNTDNHKANHCNGVNVSLLPQKDDQLG